MASGSSLESDLRAIREARGLSLDDIQHETRIPVDVLRRFESGDLAQDPSFNPIYLKALIGSYASAIGVPSTDVSRAIDAQRAGSYAGDLSLEGGKKTSSAPPPASTPSAAEVAGDTPTAPPETSAPKRPEAPAAPPAVEAIRDAPAAPPPSSEPPQTLAQVRASRPPVPSARRSFDKNWGTILGLTAALVAVLAGALWFLVFRDADPSEGDGQATMTTATNNRPAEIDSSGVGAGAATQGPRLQLPIRVTVTATGNGLQNFRVTESPKERLGHWIEPGSSKTFSSDSLLIFWGEGAEGIGTEATLELQGQRWTPASNAVLRIDRASGQRLLDSLSAAGPAPAAAVPGTPAPDANAFE